MEESQPWRSKSRMLHIERQGHHKAAVCSMQVYPFHLFSGIILQVDERLTACNFHIQRTFS